MKKFFKFLLIPLCFIFSFIIVFDSHKDVNAQAILSESDNIIVLPGITYQSNIGYDVVTTYSYIGWSYDSNGNVDVNIYVANTNFNLTRYDFDFDVGYGDIVLPYFSKNGVYWTDVTTDVSFTYNSTEEEFITYFESINNFMIRIVANSYIQYNFMASSFSTSMPLFTVFYDLGNNFNPSITRTYPVMNPVTFGGLSGSDYASAYEEGRTIGFEEGKSYAKDYYYELGKQEGLNQSNPYTFYNLIGAVIDVPINAFKSLLNFNLFDVNLLDFVLSILTFFLILKVIGWFSGRS